LPPIDPLTLAGTTALVMLAAGTASIVPAFRAARLDPSKVLRF
jgi:ABC-type lipoprotein release transport system permease subunit